MQKLIEFKENQDTPLYRPSHLEDLKHKSEYFEVPDLETKIQTHDNPHYWLQQDILQVKNFQYRFFNNITLTNDNIPQVKVFTQFLFKFFRFNYQLLWEQQDQQAYIQFPQILTQTELLPYIIKNEHRHLQYRNLTSFNTTYFEQVDLDHNFFKLIILKHQIADLILHLIFPLKQLQKNKLLMLCLKILDNFPYNQNKKIFLTFFKIQNHIKQIHYIHKYQKFPIYTN